jgi:hypothetical protein
VLRISFHEHDPMSFGQHPAQVVRGNDAADAAATDHNRF